MPDLKPPLQGCHVISLRPVGQHDPLRRIAGRAGARVIALSPWVLTPILGDDVAERLRAALAAPTLVFTSPAAVSAANAIEPLAGLGPRDVLAVGASTARALKRCGIATVRFPQRMDSEGLLALPDLTQVRNQTIGMITAPEGRTRLAAELSARGACIVRADVYRREPIPARRDAIGRLLDANGALLLPVSSGQALEHMLHALPSPAAMRLRSATAVAAGARLATLAAAHGFPTVVQAADARPRSLVEAMIAHVRGSVDPVA